MTRKFGKGGLRQTLAALMALLSAWMVSAGSAVAQRIGRSEPGQLDLQAPATQAGVQLQDLHIRMLVIAAAICALVLALLLIVIVRYNKRANPTPARWTHNTPLEVFWTLAPVIVLIVIMIPSVRLLQLQEDFDAIEPDLVIKATGNQWNWTYTYRDSGVEFDSYMLGGGQAELNDTVRQELSEAGYPETAWKLATDTAMVVPVGKNVLMQITASDVIHAWAVPAFSVKADGVPGRINRQWFNAEEEGVYYGQCSELCGKDHAYMPITVRVVSQGVFDAWLSCAQAGDVAECAPEPVSGALVSEVVSDSEAVQVAQR